MDPFLGAALATGAADFIGGLWSNRANQREARANRSFQERISSTSAQRAVEDYRKAGLNPALAYDRPASSPGGSVLPMENPVGKAVSSGLSAAMARNQNVLALEQAKNLQADTAKKGIEGANAAVQGDLLRQDQLLKGQELAFRTAVQPHQVRAAAIANLRDQFGLSKAEAESKYYDMMGATAPAIENLAGPVGGVVGGAGAAAMLLLRNRGMGAGSAKVMSGLFKRPAPRRVGDWEKSTSNPVRRPKGFTPNSP